MLRQQGGHQAHGRVQEEAREQQRGGEEVPPEDVRVAARAREAHEGARGREQAAHIDRRHAQQGDEHPQEPHHLHESATKTTRSHTTSDQTARRVQLISIFIHMYVHSRLV